MTIPVSKGGGKLSGTNMLSTQRAKGDMDKAVNILNNKLLSLKSG
jgi:hypothetical protein